MRGIILVLDSLGIGSAPDAVRFGDEGADTLGHVLDSRRLAGRESWALPNLSRIGLFRAHGLARGEAQDGVGLSFSHGGREFGVRVGCLEEVSLGKDTPSGHWEMAGLAVDRVWRLFPDTRPSFPSELIASLIARTGVPGVLGDEHASGTEIIARLGPEHIRTGKPIVYTSADSVFQVAAHEEAFGLDRLYALCEAAFEMVAPMGVGRVIARPFVGDETAGFRRTGNRHDYTVKPFGPTLLTRLAGEGREVISVGKIADIFAGEGVTRRFKGDGNDALFDATLEAVRGAEEGSLVFSNFVDFDMLYGHRRDPEGYGEALAAFDRRLPELWSLMGEGDVCVVTADHGCDPTFRGTEHTREYVPGLWFGIGMDSGVVGRVRDFGVIAGTMAVHLGVGGEGFPPPLGA